MGLLGGLFNLVGGFKPVEPVGKIVQGTCYGCVILPGIRSDDNTEDSNSFVICSSTQLDKQGRGLYDKGDKKYFGEIGVLNRNTIDHYEEVGSNQSGPNAGAFISGTLIGGPVLGAAAAMSSISNTADIAVYMKDGSKSIIHFYTQEAAGRLRRIAYKL